MVPLPVTRAFGFFFSELVRWCCDEGGGSLAHADDWRGSVAVPDGRKEAEPLEIMAARPLLHAPPGTMAVTMPAGWWW